MPCNFAGSAIAQGPNVGRIDRWLQWNPTTAEPLWLLLAGASDPPSGIHISDRRTRDAPGVRGGTFLPGVTRDLIHVEETVGTKLLNTIRDFFITKSVAFDHIRRLFDTCKRRAVQPMLYYTGHGEIGTGNWCFSDGTISIQEILDMMPEGVYHPMIFSDACFSGHWANFCLEKNIAGFNCLAACPEYSSAIDTRGEGGDLTLFMTGRKPRPSTEPMYSGGNIKDFPITRGYDAVDYTDFIRSHINNNSKNILICQSLCNGYFYGCFAPSKMFNPRPAVSWAIRNNYDTFFELVTENWRWINGKSKQIYSLACDENLGFGVFFMENYGTHQYIVTNTSDIQEKCNEGYKITACAAKGSTFYVIMTKGTKEYKGKRQYWFTRNTWADTCSEMDAQGREGKRITALCYSSGLRQYFVVMTELPEGQLFKLCGNGNDYIDWMNETWKEGYHPTITFRDPNLKQTLIVMTTDKNRSGYTSRCWYKIK